EEEHEGKRLEPDSNCEARRIRGRDPFLDRILGVSGVPMNREPSYREHDKQEARNRPCAKQHCWAHGAINIPSECEGGSRCEGGMLRRIETELIPVVRPLGRARSRGAIAKQPLWPGQGANRLLDAGDEAVVVLTRLRRQRVTEGDAGGGPAGGPAGAGED